MDFLEYLRNSLPVQAASLPFRALDAYNENVVTPMRAHALDISTRDDLGARIQRNTPVGLLMRMGMQGVGNDPVLKRDIQKSIKEGDKKGAVSKFARSEGFLNELISGAANDPLSYLAGAVPAFTRMASSGNQAIRAAGKTGLVVNDPIGAALATKQGKKVSKTVKEQVKKVPVPAAVKKFASQSRDSFLQMKNREISNALHLSIGRYFPDRPSEGLEFLDEMEKRAKQAGYSSIPDFMTSPDYRSNTDINPKFFQGDKDTPSTFMRYVSALKELGREIGESKPKAADLPPRPVDPDAGYNEDLFKTALKVWQKRSSKLFDPAKITPEMKAAVNEAHFKGGAMELLDQMYRGEWKPPVSKQSPIKASELRDGDFVDFRNDTWEKRGKFLVSKENGGKVKIDSTDADMIVSGGEVRKIYLRDEDFNFEVPKGKPTFDSSNPMHSKIQQLLEMGMIDETTAEHIIELSQSKAIKSKFDIAPGTKSKFSPGELNVLELGKGSSREAPHEFGHFLMNELGISESEPLKAFMKSRGLSSQSEAFADSFALWFLERKAGRPSSVGPELDKLFNDAVYGVDEEAERLAAKAAAEAELKATFSKAVQRDLDQGNITRDALQPKQLDAIEVSPFQRTGLAIPSGHWQVLQANKDNIIEGANRFEQDRTLIREFLKSNGVNPDDVKSLKDEIARLTEQMGDKKFSTFTSAGEFKAAKKDIDKAFNFWHRLGVNPLSGDEGVAINSYLNRQFKKDPEAKSKFAGVGDKLGGIWPKWTQGMRLWRSQATASLGNLVYNGMDAGFKNLITIGKESVQDGKLDGNTVMMNPLYILNHTIKNLGVKDPGDFLQPPDVLRKQAVWGQTYQQGKATKSLIPVELRQNWSYLEDQSTLAKNPWDDFSTPNKRMVVGGAMGLLGGGLPGMAMSGMAGRHMNDIVRVFRLASGALEFSARTAQWMYNKEKFLTENLQTFADQTFSSNNPAKAAFLSDGIFQSPEMLAKKLKTAGVDQATTNKAVQGWTNMLESADKAGVAKAFDVHFDYGNFTGVDAALRNVTAFHYWATRNVPWYGNYLIHNPWLSTALWRLQDTSDRMVDDENLPDRFKTLLPVTGLPDMLTNVLFGSNGEMFSNPAQYISILQQINKTSGDESVADRLGQLGNMGLGLNPALDTAAQFFGVKGTDPVNNMFRLSAPISGIAGAINRKPADVEAPYKELITSGVETATGKRPFDATQYAIKKLIAERSVRETGKPNHPDYVKAMNDPESQIYKDAAAQIANMNAFQSLYYFTGSPVYKHLSDTEKEVRKKQLEGPDPDEESLANTYRHVNDKKPEDPKVILEKWKKATTKERLVLWRDEQVRKVVGEFTKSTVKK